jgi:hypothetical protein
VTIRRSQARHSEVRALASDPSTPTPKRNPALDAVVAMLIGPVLLVLAAWFWFGPDLTDIPSAAGAPVSRAEVDAGPWREMMPSPPTTLVAGFTKKCSECHDLFRSDPDTPLRLSQHRDIVQAHGMNDRCFNCHDQLDRTLLVLSPGKTVGFDQVELLCAKCHGPTYRDWELGMHGRTNGYWDESRGERVRLTCTQCHDPHAPAFAPMATLPGPVTLRMGEPEKGGHDVRVRRNPLRQWSRDVPSTHGEAP